MSKMTPELTTRACVMFGLKSCAWLLMTIMILVPMFDDKAVMWMDPSVRVGMFTTYGSDPSNTPAFLNMMGVGLKVGLGIQGCAVVALLMTTLSFVFYTVAVFGAGNNVALRSIAGVADALTFVMCITVAGLVGSATSTVTTNSDYAALGHAVPLFSCAALLAALSPLLSWCVGDAPFSCCCPPAAYENPRPAQPYPCAVADGYVTLPARTV
ncbi:hypothetical protein DIPPA_24688 [Diplonema papillatum]|nr:hypothetical protein DIPPA_24688 [Diplonema papillatum]